MRMRRTLNCNSINMGQEWILLGALFLNLCSDCIYIKRSKLNWEITLATACIAGDIEECIFCLGLGGMATLTVCLKLITRGLWDSHCAAELPHT